MKLGKRATTLIQKVGKEEAYKKFLQNPKFYGQAAVELAKTKPGILTKNEEIALVRERISAGDTAWIRVNKTLIQELWFWLSSTEEQKIESIWNS